MKVKFHSGQRVNVKSLLPLGVCIIEYVGPFCVVDRYRIKVLSGDYKGFVFWMEESRLSLAKEKVTVL